MAPAPRTDAVRKPAYTSNLANLCLAVFLGEHSSPESSVFIRVRFFSERLFEYVRVQDKKPHATEVHGSHNECD